MHLNTLTFHKWDLCENQDSGWRTEMTLEIIYSNYLSSINKETEDVLKNYS